VRAAVNVTRNATAPSTRAWRLRRMTWCAYRPTSSAQPGSDRGCARVVEATARTVALAVPGLLSGDLERSGELGGFGAGRTGDRVVGRPRSRPRDPPGERPPHEPVGVRCAD